MFVRAFRPSVRITSPIEAVAPHLCGFAYTNRIALESHPTERGDLMANKDKGGAKDSKKAPKKNLKEKRKEKKLKKDK